nr:hypothetical protein [Nonomuraea wenchangensis]
MPLEKLGVGPVARSGRDVDLLAGSAVELLAVAELLAQSGADQQSVLGVDRQVAAVEQRVQVRTEKQAVVQAMFAARRDRPNVGGLQDRTDPVTTDRAPAFVRVQHHGLECLLAEPAGASRGSS